MGVPAGTALKIVYQTDRSDFPDQSLETEARE